MKFLILKMRLNGFIFYNFKNQINFIELNVH